MNLLPLLRRQRILAIVRGSNPAAALECVHALADEGIGIVEVSLTSIDALKVLRRARETLGQHITLGAGTVLTSQDTHAAIHAGATFMVTPCLGPAVTEAVRLGVPVLAGALTPTEVAQAVDQGATAVKLFPASIGGVDYLRALRGPFPRVPFVPVGGIDAQAATAYLAAGGLAVGIGSPLLEDAADGGSIDALRRRARLFRAAIPALAGDQP